MSDEIFESPEEVKEWMTYYEDGGELPDDVIQKLLTMSLIYAQCNQVWKKR